MSSFAFLSVYLSKIILGMHLIFYHFYINIKKFNNKLILEKIELILMQEVQRFKLIKHKLDFYK